MRQLMQAYGFLDDHEQDFSITTPRIRDSRGSLPPKALYGIYVMQLWSEERKYQAECGELLYTRYPTYEEFQQFLLERKQPYRKGPGGFVTADGTKFPPQDSSLIQRLARLLVSDPGIEQLANKLDKKHKTGEHARRNSRPKQT